MSRSDWMDRTYGFSWLERYSEQFYQMRSIFIWLKAIGVIPNDVNSAPPSQVKLELDPEAIKAGYLASVAHEWDTWGDSSPLDFMKALRCELKGSTERDTISQALLSLGRGLTAEPWT